MARIISESCWVIKVTYLKTGEVNFNEAYREYNRCMLAIKDKLKGKAFTMINDFIYKDIDNEIVYEAKCVDLYE